MLFAVSTMVSWAYYGMKGWAYLFGEAERNHRIYSVIFCVFVAIGASTKLDSVLRFSDAMVFVLCVPSILGLVLLAPVVRKELAALRERAAELNETGFNGG